MIPFYARSLIQLLKFLGWEQQAIAKHLKVSTSAISLWATGKRPVPLRHAKAFFGLVLQAYRDDYSAIEPALNALPVGIRDAPREEQARRLAKLREVEAHFQQVSAYINAWQIEMDVAAGRFSEAVQDELKILRSPYAQIDPLKLPRDERRKLRNACQTLIRHFDYLDQIEIPTPQDPNTNPSTPEARLESIRQWFGITIEED